MSDEKPCPEGFRHAMNCYTGRNIGHVHPRPPEEWLWDAIQAYNNNKLPTVTFLEVNGLRMDLQRKAVTCQGEALPMSPLKYRLLRYLMQHVDEFLPARQILKAVWGSAHEDSHQYLRVAIADLRKILGADFVKTQIGGYIMERRHDDDKAA